MLDLRRLWTKWQINRMLKLTVEQRIERITRLALPTAAQPRHPMAEGYK